METPSINDNKFSLWRKIAINTGTAAGANGQVIYVNENKMSLLKKICLNLAALVP